MALRRSAAFLQRRKLILLVDFRRRSDCLRQHALRRRRDDRGKRMPAKTKKAAHKRGFKKS
jgi:hypothetical protein